LTVFYDPSCTSYVHSVFNPFLCEDHTHTHTHTLTSHAIVGEPLAELVDHDEEDADGISTTLRRLYNTHTHTHTHMSFNYTYNLSRMW